MAGSDLMESWFCIWDDLANPKIRLNLNPKRPDPLDLLS
jgi:hypothetical protein